MKEKPTKVRWGLAFFFFIIGVIAYMDRSNISIIAKPMMDDLGLDKVQFGMLASLFSLGYALVQIPAGLLAEKFGPRKMVTFALIWWSVFTGLTGLVKSHGLLYAVRFLFGVGEGPMFPANAVFNTNWFRRDEKARASSALLAGSYFGPVIAPIVTVYIYQYFGWQAVFYIFGLVGIIIAGVWWVIARDYPEIHKLVNEKEKEYILEGREIVNTTKARAPWNTFLKNYRFWAIGLQYFVVLYIITFFLVWLPTYLLEDRGFSLSKMGFAASLPWLAILITVMTGGILSDYLVRKGFSKQISRSSLAISGLIVFIISMYLAVMAVSPYMNVLWLSLCLGSLGFTVVCSWASATDLGRNFSGSVSGWMNLWGNLGAFVSPLLCGWLAEKFGWNITLGVTVIPVFIAAILWLFVKPDTSLLNSLEE
ncbi:MFS transporter [Lysinibacillus sp. NPDC093210]|uniref:MFS transporter n=1 Tax=Lysinibacillus sp. NPDC093210 TaxID=3364133 RepID=UPI003802AEE5